MKKTAISLCILGFATVNARRHNNNLGGLAPVGALGMEDQAAPSLSGSKLFEPLTGEEELPADLCADTDDWFKEDWEANCEDFNDDKC